VAVPEREEEDQADDRERHDGGGDRRGQTRPDQHDADEGKVERHRHRSELEEEPRSVARRGEDHQLIASPSNPSSPLYRCVVVPC
jgi:hypothetical protein